MSLFIRIQWLGFALLIAAASLQAEPIRIATYNVENYILHETETRKAKPEESRLMVQKAILAARPDVLAIQEMGDLASLRDLQTGLKKGGLSLPHWEHITGWDTNIHLAVLSRFPIVARRPHTNENYLVDGRRMRVSRGLLEVDIRVSPRYTFTLFNAHLKSKRPIPEADQAKMRLAEATILREKVDRHLNRNPRADLIVLGDLNDTPNERPIRALVGRGRLQLEDTRPAEGNGDSGYRVRPQYDPRTIAWTYHYGLDDTFSRFDYILLSPGMAEEWRQEESFVQTIPDWGLASDHRLVLVTIETEK